LLKISQNNINIEKQNSKSNPFNNVEVLNQVVSHKNKESTRRKSIFETSSIFQMNAIEYRDKLTIQLPRNYRT